MSSYENVTAEDVSQELKLHFQLFPISMDTEECNRFSVRRNHLWIDTIRFLSRQSFDNKKNQYVFLSLGNPVLITVVLVESTFI